ncbi:MAG: glutamate 5-kinase [Pseudomonadota bacterium]
MKPRAHDYLTSCHSIVIKIGSAMLVEDGALRRDWLVALAADIAELATDGKRVTIVSSGAVALGTSVLGGRASLSTLPEKQAAAAIGQIELSVAWREALQDAGLRCAQVLLTPEDTEHRRRHLNARDTLTTLAAAGVVAVINENDTVATDELRYGDNDRLAARVAQMIGADVLLLLSDVDGLYSGDPTHTSSVEHIPEVAQIDDALMAMADGPTNAVGTGGMRSKLSAAQIATQAGIAMIIAAGTDARPLRGLKQGAKHTLFLPAVTPRRARQRWIAAFLKHASRIDIDAGALRALEARNSLLPIGVRAVSGEFRRGDCVAVYCDGDEVAAGLVRMSSDDARARMQQAKRGERTDALIHADDLVLRRRVRSS